MSNLSSFVNKNLLRANLHTNSQYIFDWPGVFPTIDTEATDSQRFGRAIVQNIEIGPTDHTELALSIDGHSIPILSTPVLATSMSMTLMLDKHIVDGTYGKLLTLMYHSNMAIPPGNIVSDKRTTTGLSRYNFTPPIESNTGQTSLARLYVLNENYKTATDGEFNPADSAHILIHHPRVKNLSSLSFDSTSSEVSKCRLELVFAWYDWMSITR